MKRFRDIRLVFILIFIFIMAFYGLMFYLGNHRQISDIAILPLLIIC